MCSITVSILTCLNSWLLLSFHLATFSSDGFAIWIVQTIASDVAGNGLGQNVDGSLETKVDDATLEVTADVLNVKDLGITTAKLADDAVTADKLADTAVSAGTYGSTTVSPQITVDAQGRITNVSNQTISGGGGSGGIGLNQTAPHKMNRF